MNLRPLTQRQLTELNALLPAMESGLLTPAQADALARLRRVVPFDTSDVPALRRAVHIGLGGLGVEA